MHFPASTSVRIKLLTVVMCYFIVQSKPARILSSKKQYTSCLQKNNNVRRAMALIESESAFKKRCEELKTGLFRQLNAQSVSSFSTLAFVFCSPQNEVKEDDMTQVCDEVFDGQTTLGMAVIRRRLHFEACILLMAGMKAQVSSVDPSEVVRKLPFVEKQNRLEAEKNRLVGTR